MALNKLTNDEWEAYQKFFDSESLLRRLRESGTALEMQQVISDALNGTPEHLRPAFEHLFDTVLMPALRSDLSALAVEIEELELHFTVERTRKLMDRQR